MATPQKNSNLEVEGYIHQVSDLKQASGSKNNYFTAVLQEADRSSRVVVFAQQHHTFFKRAEKDKSPIKATNVALNPSRQQEGSTDVLVNYKSKLTCLRSLNFVFDDTRTEEIVAKTLQEILDNPVEYQRVSVTVCVMEEKENSHEYTKGNTATPLKKVVYSVSDKTASLLLTVWGIMSLQLHQWYLVKNVSVRVFMGRTGLSTTRDTTVQEVAHAGPSVEPEAEDNDVFEGEIVMADIQIDHICPNRHTLDLVNTATLMTRCQSCKAFCKTSKISFVARGSITILDSQGTQHTFHLHDKIIRSALDFDISSVSQPEAVTAEILRHDNAKIISDGTRVLSLEFLKGEEQSELSESLLLGLPLEFEDK